jgi:hypothetical protein
MRPIVVWLQSLPIQATTAIVATLSALVTLVVWVRARRGAVRWTVVLAGPFLVAAVVYYLPVFLDAHADYGSWTGLFIGIWGTAGVAASVVVALVWTALSRGRRL